MKSQTGYDKAIRDWNKHIKELMDKVEVNSKEWNDLREKEVY